MATRTGGPAPACAAPRGEHAMSTQPQPLPVAVKKIPRTNDAFVTYLYKIADSLEGNAAFPNPSPTPTAIRAAADALALANARAVRGGEIAVADRNVKRQDAEGLVDQLVGYVRATVRAQATDAASATAMIVGVGLSVRKRGRPPKAALAVKHGSVSGEMLIVALAVAKTAMYFWEMSVDLATWTSLPQTLSADTAVAGLVPGQLYHFRFRAQTRAGMSDYSQVVSLRAL